TAPANDAAPTERVPADRRLERGCPLVQQVLEGLPGLELRRLGGRDLDRLARLRVAPRAGLAIGHGERAEPGDVHLVAVAESRDDIREIRVDRTLGLALRQVDLRRHRFDQVRLGHVPSPPWSVEATPL